MIFVSNVRTSKYVDDMTVAEIVPRGLQGDIQFAVDIVEGWSQVQCMPLNATKCDEVKSKGKVSAYEPEGSSGRRLSPVSVA